jgi:hypothetical protein
MSDPIADPFLRPMDVWHPLGYGSLAAFNTERLSRPHQHPPYIRRGARILYRRSDLARWAEDPNWNAAQYLNK